MMAAALPRAVPRAVGTWPLPALLMLCGLTHSHTPPSPAAGHPPPHRKDVAGQQGSVKKIPTAKAPIWRSQPEI